MRYLAWFSLGFAAACLSSAYFLAPSYLVLTAVVCLVCAGISFVLRKKAGKLLAVFLFFLGAACGVFRFYAAYNNTALKAENADGLSEYITAEVTDLPESTSDYERVSVRILGGSCKGLRSVF